MSVLPVSNAAVPADVRASGDDAVARYRSAQGFEQLLVSRLAQAMTAGTPLAEGPYAGSITEGLAEGLTAGGGLGLTDQLYRSMTLDAPKVDAS